MGGGGGDNPVFSGCSFIARADFEMSLVMVSCYSYEILRHKYGMAW